MILREFLALTNPTGDQFSEYVDLDSLINDVKITNVEFNSEASTLYLVFKDGSKEDALDYFQNFFDDMVSIIDRYIGG